LSTPSYQAGVQASSSRCVAGSRTSKSEPFQLMRVKRWRHRNNRAGQNAGIRFPSRHLGYSYY